MKKIRSKPQAGGTFNLLENVAPNLYRHPKNKQYYGARKVAGARRVHNLETTDRKLADRKLAEWLDGIAKTDPDAAALTMAGLFARYRRLNPKAADSSALAAFERTFRPGMAARVSKVKPSDVAEWFVENLEDLEPSSFNEYRRVLVRVFDLAVLDRAIPAPGIFNADLVPKKKENEIIRNIPTAEDFAAILAEMRQAAEFNHPNSQAADFTEFMGVVGVGQAEASTIRLADISEHALKFRRMKTGKPFEIPNFAATKAFLAGWLERRKEIGLDGEERLFTIRDSSAAFLAAVEALKLPRYTLRNLRSMRIVAWLDAGVDVKQVAEWQGHSDGGKLIWERYSEVVRADKKRYLNEQIARAEGQIVRFKDG